MATITTIATALETASISEAAASIVRDLLDISDDETTIRDLLNALEDGAYLASAGITDQAAVEAAYSFLEALR